MKTIYRFKLDMQSYISQVSIPVRQLDNAVEFRINLTDNGVPFIISNGCRAVFCARKSDMNPIMVDCMIEKNTTIVYELTQQTTAAVGVVDCEIRLYDADEKLLTTPQFILVVSERVLRDSDFPILVPEPNILDNIIRSEEQRVDAEREREKNHTTMLETTQRATETVADIERRLENGDFIGEKGDKGDTGNSGVYIGEEEPTDPDVNVWICPLSEEEVAYFIRGESAYDVAVRNGFVGSEKEWLESLKGYELTTQDKYDIADIVVRENSLE
jgi:hypothetical protein